MAQRKNLLNVEYISDHDCGTYRIGEIDTLPDEAVVNHIQRFGEFGYEEWRDFALKILFVAENEIRKNRLESASDHTNKHYGW